MTHPFDTELPARLADLADLAPGDPSDVFARVRRRAAHQRRRAATLAAAALVIVAGSGVGVARVMVSDRSETQPAAPAPASGLFAWSTHNQLLIDPVTVTDAWNLAAGVRHTQVRLLFAGQVGQATVIVAEGVENDRPRIAVLTGPVTPPTRDNRTLAATDLHLAATVGLLPRDRPEYLILHIGPASDSDAATQSDNDSVVLALTAPHAPLAQLMDPEGRRVLRLDPSTGYAMATVPRIALLRGTLSRPDWPRSHRLTVQSRQTTDFVITVFQ